MIAAWSNFQSQIECWRFSAIDWELTMRLFAVLMITLCLFEHRSAGATSIFLSPNLTLSTQAFVSPDLNPVTLAIESLSITDSTSAAISNGSGRASASGGGGGASFGGNISVLLGDGPGSAQAKLTSESNFELVFPRPGFYTFFADVEINGSIDIDVGDYGFAGWELFYEFPTDDSIGFGGQFGDSFGDRNNPFECNGGGCNFGFDVNTALLSVRIGKDLRLPVISTMFFDIGVSRSTSINEPRTALIVLFGLILLGCNALRRRPLVK
jgi:hypothetical protein